MAGLAVALAVAACGDGEEPGGAILTINNTSGSVIGFVYFTACPEPEWGDDHLGEEEAILDGASRSFDVNPDCYDIRVLSFPDLEVQELFEVEIAEGAEFIWDVPVFVEPVIRR